MSNEKFVLASKAVELSETKTYIELTNRLCYYDAPNLNGVKLPSETAEEKAQTLIDMPVVAKYKKDIYGQDNLGSHEVTIDANGNVHFGTENIGVHTAVEIKDDLVEVNGEIKTLPCLFAKSKIWCRNKNVVSAIKRLFNEGKLFSSWEILTSAFTYENGIKTLTDYVFESNCLLGSNVSPAYGSTSCALGLASVESSELLIAEALANDINTISEEQEENDLKEENNVEISTEENTEVETETVAISTENNGTVAEVDSTATETNDQSNEEETTEVSALTEWDLRKAIQKACREKINQWCWITYHFPTDKTVWVEYDERASELDYKLFTYEVTNDVVTVSDPQDVKLTVSIAEVNTVIAQKDDALIKANDTIQSLQSQIANLTPFKEAYEKAEQERIEQETASKRTELTNKLEKSNLFSKEELESSEIKQMIEKVDEAGIKNLMADKFMASLDAVEVKSENIETSTVSTTVVAEKADINVDEVGFNFTEFLNVYSNKN